MMFGGKSSDSYKYGYYSSINLNMKRQDKIKLVIKFRNFMRELILVKSMMILRWEKSGIIELNEPFALMWYNDKKTTSYNTYIFVKDVIRICRMYVIK